MIKLLPWWVDCRLKLVLPKLVCAWSTRYFWEVNNWRSVSTACLGALWGTSNDILLLKVPLLDIYWSKGSLHSLMNAGQSGWASQCQSLDPWMKESRTVHSSSPAWRVSMLVWSFEEMNRICGLSVNIANDQLDAQMGSTTMSAWAQRAWGSHKCGRPCDSLGEA